MVGWKFPRDLIDQIPGLKAICLQTTGYEWIDYEYCRRKGIMVTNVPHYATNAVAEKAVFMALALAKKFPLFAREGKMNWAPQFIGDELYGRPTDIIGLGDIGARLAEIFDPLVGTKEICYYDTQRKDTRFHYLDFPDMLKKCEYMFVTVSKNPESLALFDDLSHFNPNMKVIIVANGFEELAQRLAAMCEAGQLGGVAFESDQPSNHNFKSNVFVTPPNAYYTEQALAKLFETWTKTILSATENPINIVNN